MKIEILVAETGEILQTKCKNISELFIEFPWIKYVETEAWYNNIYKTIYRVTGVNISKSFAKVGKFLYNPLRYIDKSDETSDKNKITPLLKCVNKQGIYNVITDVSKCFIKSNLTNLDLSKWYTKDVKDMSYMFYDCSSLKTINISNFDTSSVTNFEGMFKCCSSLKTINISNFDTSSVQNMQEMFYNCLSLQSLDISQWDVSKVENMSFMFCNCLSLQTLDINKWRIMEDINASYMFGDCEKIDKIKLPQYLEKYKNYMFPNCKMLKTVYYNKNKVDMTRTYYKYLPSPFIFNP